MESLFKIFKDFLKISYTLKKQIILIIFLPVLLMLIITIKEEVLFDSILTLAPQDLGDEFVEFKQYSVGSLEYLEQNVSNLAFRAFLASLSSKKLARNIYKDPIYNEILDDPIYINILNNSQMDKKFFSEEEIRIKSIQDYLSKVILIDSSDRWSLDAYVRLRSNDQIRGNSILKGLIFIADDMLRNEYRDFFDAKTKEQLTYKASIDSVLITQAFFKSIHHNEWVSKKYLSSKPFAFKFTETVDNNPNHSRPRLFANLYLLIVFIFWSFVARVLFLMVKEKLSNSSLA